MANFTPSKKTASDFNNGIAYKDGDIPQPNALNSIVEGLLYAQESGGGSPYYHFVKISSSADDIWAAFISSRKEEYTTVQQIYEDLGEITVFANGYVSSYGENVSNITILALGQVEYETVSAETGIFPVVRFTDKATKII